MKFFIDTAKVEDIKAANDMGVICGVTTNPSLIAKEGRDFKEVIKEITSIVDGWQQQDCFYRRRTDQWRGKGYYNRCRGHDCRRA